jgi:hypothetical protein
MTDTRSRPLRRVSLPSRDHRPCCVAVFPLPARPPHAGGVAGRAASSSATKLYGNGRPNSVSSSPTRSVGACRHDRPAGRAILPRRRSFRSWQQHAPRVSRTLPCPSGGVRAGRWAVQARDRLNAGGKWLGILGPCQGLSPIRAVGAETDVGRRNDTFSTAVLMVRIRLPPAESQLRT